MNPRQFLASSAVGLTVSLVVANANAQIVDEADFRRDGADAVLVVRFGTEVQFQRAIVARSGDVAIVTYNLLATTNTRLNLSAQTLRLASRPGLPAIQVSDEADRGEQARRLVLRFGEGVAASARAGKGNRTIEIVFPGKGAALAPSAAAGSVRGSAVSAPAAAAGRFVIVLQSSATPGTMLAKPLPASLQAYGLYTTQRRVGGELRHEIHLGPFATRAEAEAALPRLRDFPLARVAAHEDSMAAPAVATAPPAVGPTPQAPPVIPGASPVAPSTATATVTAAALPTQGSPEHEAKAAELMARARDASAARQYDVAVEALNQLLELPPTSFTREAQEMAGMVRLRAGDPMRARAEFETYLQLFPTGEGSDRVRRELAALPVAPAASTSAAAGRPEPEVTLGGSTSMTYYGGNGQVRSRDFQDSPISGLPQQAGDPLFTADKSRQVYNDVDVNWRRRNAEVDQRFVLRDSYTTDLERPQKSRNRLSALYFDHKSIGDGWGARVGRQSPTGGGVMSRFDGVQGNWFVRPRWKLGAVVGEPVDRFFDSRRRFYGASLDLDRLTPSFGAGAYLIEQRIDGEIDRRAIGLDMRYFKGGASVFSQFDYDLLIRGVNIATVQGTLILEDNTVINALYDRRALTTLTLGNALTFGDPANPGQLFTRIGDKLAVVPVDALREQIKRITPTITQAQLGITKPLTKHWQTGASVQLSNIGAIPPVPEVAGFEQGRPATGNVVTVSAQLIGLNLYSGRDTHVLSGSIIDGPTLKGRLVSYNNSSFAWDVWQIEPSLQYYRDRGEQGARSQRWTPGLRITYRGWQRWALESSLTYEIGRATRYTMDPRNPGSMITTEESSNRVNYSLGARYEF